MDTQKSVEEIEANEFREAAVAEEKIDIDAEILLEMVQNMPTGATGEKIVNICEMVPRDILMENGKGHIAYLTYGRYQPGHGGHQMLFDGMLEEAGARGRMEAEIGGTNVFVFASPTGGPEWVAVKKLGPKKESKNPLSPADKVDLLFQQNYDRPIFFINSELIPIKTKSIIGAIKLLAQCYEKIAIRLGSDQVPHFQWLMGSKVKDLIDSIASPPSVKSRDMSGKSDDVTGLSSSKIRKAAIEGDRDFVAKAIQLTDRVTDIRVDDVIGKIRAAAGERTQKAGRRRRTCKYRKRRRRKTRKRKFTRRKRIKKKRKTKRRRKF